jgi:tetratricopeptide (TPR) repeat protein
MAKSKHNRKRKPRNQPRPRAGRARGVQFSAGPDHLRLMSFEIHGEPLGKIHPRVEPLLTKAIDALRAGKGAKAEGFLKQALEIDPNDPPLLNNLSMAYALQGQKQKAEELTYEIHSRFPDYLFGRTNLALILIDQGEIERADELIQPLLSRKRFHFAEFSALCIVHIKLLLAEGNREAAKSWLEMLEQVDPADPNLPALRAQVNPNVRDLLRALIRR